MNIRISAYSEQIHKKLINFFNEHKEEYNFQDYFPNYYSYETSELKIQIIGTCHKSSYVYLYFNGDKISKKYLQLLDIFKNEPEPTNIIDSIIRENIPEVKPVDEDLYL